MTVYTKDFVVNNGLQISGYITSVGGSTPNNGQLMIGDATNNRWSVGSLTGANGISLTNGAGTIQVSTNATPNLTSNTIVSRDASGNFSAGTITANIAGGTISGTTGTFTGLTNFTGGLYTTQSASATSIGVNGGGSVLLINGSGATDSKKWDINTSPTVLSFRTIDDAWTTGVPWLSATRSGNAVTAINTSVRPTFNGNLAWDAGNFTPSNYATLANPTFTGRVYIPEGSASAPGLSFVNDGAIDTGLYHISDGVFGITCNTVPQVTFSNTAGTTFQTTTTFAARTIRSNSTYAAAGTTQGTATAMTTECCFVTSASAANAGVIMPSAVAGATCFVVNNSGQTIIVYPPSGNYVNYQAVNVGLSMPNQSQLVFCSDGATWFSMNSTFA
jgi:hypothetical protein